jgi:uncharacterized membrane protein (UPF0127 family)
MMYSLSGRVIKVREAKSAVERFVGLLGTKNIESDEGLLIHQCNSIHTFFMAYPIDVIFLDKSEKVIKIIRNLKPWRMTSMYWKASKVLELKAGTIPHELHEGSVIRKIDHV